MIDGGIANETENQDAKDIEPTEGNPETQRQQPAHDEVELVCRNPCMAGRHIPPPLEKTFYAISDHRTQPGCQTEDKPVVI
jgi:hypothetical protein